MFSVVYILCAIYKIGSVKTEESALNFHHSFYWVHVVTVIIRWQKKRNKQMIDILMRGIK